MSIDTLLESLQTQIHAKTSLLPTLYSRLGLPPSALTDELTLLQNKLSECVDQVVAARQSEVDSWLERCRSVDRQIEALLKATGGSKPAYPTDLPLPKQHESLCKLREKLNQLYKTKLEQFTSIRSRLVNFTRILGETFVCYRPQSVDSTQDDILIDLTPEALSKLEKDMVRCKNEASRRQTILVETFDQLEWLRAELGVPLPSPDPFLADGEGPDQQSIFSAILDKYLNRRDSFVLTAVEPTQELLEWTADLTERMENLKMKREAHIQSIYDQLEALWKRLGIEDSEIDEFVDSWQGSNDAVIEAYENELERMLELKRSTMSTFIENARKEIEELWDELMMGETQRKAFLPFIDDEHTDELLTVHEDEIKRLKEEYRSKQRLLASIKKYTEICEEEKELQASANDQSRLLGRGPRDPGRLLREEKMRKRVMKEKPKLEQDLITSIAQWESEHRAVFLVKGLSFLEVLSHNQDRQDAEKENRKRPRPNVVPTRGTTPGPSAGPVAGNSRTTPASTQPTNKRIRVESGAGYHAGVPGSAPVYPHPHPHAIRTGSVTPTPLGAYHGNQQRQVLGSRNGLMNMATPSIAVGGGKTPGSSLPRPMSKLGFGLGQGADHFATNGIVQPIPMLAQGYAGLGLGMPSMKGVGAGMGGHARTISSSSTSTTHSRSVSSSSNAPVLGAGGGGAGQKRESFRPRASVDHRPWGPGESTKGPGMAMRGEEVLREVDEF